MIKDKSPAEILAKDLENQVFLGSYSWTNTNSLMLQAAKLLRKQAKEIVKLKELT